MRNLEATRDRVRTFLDQAKTVKDALEVNRQLSEIEDQIEQVKGRLNYLRDRAAFSTITVTLNPILPTSTPASDAWRPGEAVEEAVEMSLSILQGLTELFIWFIIVPLPFLVALGALYWVTVRLARRFGTRRSVPPPPVVKEREDEAEA